MSETIQVILEPDLSLKGIYRLSFEGVVLPDGKTGEPLKVLKSEAHAFAYGDRNGWLTRTANAMVNPGELKDITPAATKGTSSRHRSP